jgi:hypothetical protein
MTQLKTVPEKDKTVLKNLQTVFYSHIPLVWYNIFLLGVSRSGIYRHECCLDPLGLASSPRRNTYQRHRAAAAETDSFKWFESNVGSKNGAWAIRARKPTAWGAILQITIKTAAIWRIAIVFNWQLHPIIRIAYMLIGLDQLGLRLINIKIKLTVNWFTITYIFSYSNL